QKLGVTLVISPVANVQALQAELASRKADIAAAQLTADAGWLAIGDAAPPYHPDREFEARRALGQSAGTGAAEIEEHRRTEPGMGGHRAERSGPAGGCGLR